MRVLVLALLMMVFTQPVGAESVYYCVMSNFFSLEGDEVKKWKPERFSMSVDKQTVRLGGNGFVEGLTLKITSPQLTKGFAAREDLINGDPYGMVMFEPPNFYYSSFQVNGVSTFSATCNDF